MPINKRAPTEFDGYQKGGTFWRFLKLSKADWADVYCDLYRQVFGDTESTSEQIIADAEQRIQLRKSQGIGSRSRLAAGSGL